MPSSVTAMFFALAVASADRPPAPAAHCLDARAMSDMQSIDARQLLIRAGESRYHLLTAIDCALEGDDSALLAAHGWVCGGPREFVRTARQLCPVLEVRAIDAREYAQLARTRLAQADAALMQPVESRARRGAAKGFIGTHDYCFRPSQVRSWSATPDAIIVHTSRQRSGGNSAYRVEFSGSCPEAAFNTELVLRSGVGLDLICGNPGDVAELRRPPAEPVGVDFSASPPTLALETGSSGAAAIGVRGCRIQEVYPIDG